VYDSQAIFIENAQWIRGFRIRLNMSHSSIGNVSEFMVVSFAGMETEEQAIAAACVAARLGYPLGTIDAVEVQTGRWYVAGAQADESGLCHWLKG